MELQNQIRMNLKLGIMKLRNGKMTVIICSSAAFCSYHNVNQLEVTEKFRYLKCIWSSETFSLLGILKRVATATLF
jgi:hypothetical protein